MIPAGNLLPVLLCIPGMCHHPFPARATVHPRHVPPCTPGRAAACPSPSPAAPRHAAGGKSGVPRRLWRLETETNALRRWGFLSERQSRAPAWPPPTRCLRPCPQGSRQAGGGRPGRRVAATPTAHPAALPLARLGFLGGGAPAGKGTRCAALQKSGAFQILGVYVF